MGITRKSLFGFPPAPRQGSQYTQREVPLSQGMKSDAAWPVMAPGSSQTMRNFLPLDGILVPRSRLSSYNTIAAPFNSGGVNNLTLLSSQLWASGQSQHAVMASNGSMSRASFVSSFGLGIAGMPNQSFWQYCTTYSANLDGDMIVAAAAESHNTLLCLYQSSGVPLSSYLTSAPKALAVGAFDNYVIAFNVRSGTVANTRVQWCVRGLPSNWTGEGSGFEDLLEMKGSGRAIKGTTDGRFLLFSTQEIWAGVGAAYPAQFTFYAIDKSIGCTAPLTIDETEFGHFFLGSDGQLRLLPRGGGPSQVVAPSLSREIRYDITRIQTNLSYGYYDQNTGLYYLRLHLVTGSFAHYVINVKTGEWGTLGGGITSMLCAAMDRSPTGSYAATEGPFYANSQGTIYSFNSKIATDAGSALPCTWRSGPIASDLPGNWKQLTEVDIDYRATSLSTLTIKVSQDGGGTFESSGRSVLLSTAAVTGRATSQMYVGGAFPAIEITSESTGFELHRIDVTMGLGGRRSG